MILALNRWPQRMSRVWLIEYWATLATSASLPKCPSSSSYFSYVRCIKSLENRTDIDRVDSHVSTRDLSLPEEVASMGAKFVGSRIVIPFISKWGEVRGVVGTFATLLKHLKGPSASTEMWTWSPRSNSSTKSSSWSLTMYRLDRIGTLLRVRHGIPSQISNFHF